MSYAPVGDFDAQQQALGGFDPKELWRVVRRRWKWVALAVIAGLAIGSIKYITSPKLYRATTQLQIEPRNLVSVGQDRNPWIEQWTNLKYFPTQYRLLRSRGLAERVLDDLRLESDPDFIGSTPENDVSRTAEDDARYRAGLAGRLIGGLTVDPIEGTELLNLSYVSTDQRLAAEVANGFAEAFIQFGKESRSETLAQANRVIDTQIENLRHDVQEIEVSIREFSRTADVTGNDVGSGAVSQRVTNLNDQVSTATTNALNKQQRHGELVNMPDALVAENGGSASLKALQSELQGHDRDYQGRLQTFKPDHPDMVELKRTLDDTRRRYNLEVSKEARRLRAAAYTEWQAAQSVIDRIEQQRNVAQEQNLAQNVEVLPLTNLQMELSAKRQRLSELIETQSQADLSADVQSDGRTNVHVIDKALVPSGPFRPSLRQNVAVGAGGGLFFGLGVVFLFHFLDRTLKTGEELERLLGIPVLAAIPDLEANGQGYGYHAYYGYGRKRRSAKAKGAKNLEIELLPESNPRLAVAEAYRSLRTALLLSSAEELKLITVTSAEAGEGKSATSTNLSIVMAQLGKKVLLVDGDLRKARLHRVFKADNTQGLVNSLAAGTHPETVIQKTHVPGLSLLPAGAHPPNPSELLASERMQQLMAWARKTYDFVIIDTPPILAVSDAIVPGANSDGVVLCFRANRIERETARRCTEQVRLAGVKVLGVILNRYQPGSSRYYDRQYENYEAYAESQADSAA